MLGRGVWLPDRPKGEEIDRLFKSGRGVSVRAVRKTRRRAGREM